MRKKRAIILGAGISGLAAAYYLQKTHDVVILEKEQRPGGWLHTTNENGFLFESGPRTFRSKGSKELLELIAELGLEKEMIFSDESAKRRFVLFRGRLEEIPSKPSTLFGSPLTNGIKRSLMTEWAKTSVVDDETLWDFAKRRFGEKAADRFFDPLALGIFASSSKEISVEACFPKFKEIERKYGSLTRGMLSSLLSKKKKSPAMPGTLFSFRNGVFTLISALQERLKTNLQLETTVQSLTIKGGQVVVHTSRGVFEADCVISALPPQAIGYIIAEAAPHTSQLLREIRMKSLSMVQVGYSGEHLPQKGFGYLVPSQEKEPVLGMVFDSAVFPQHNEGAQTRLTVMLPYSEHSEKDALVKVKEHLGIVASPTYVAVRQCRDAIPLLEVGHVKRIAKIQEVLSQEVPQLKLIGNYLKGVSVNDCVKMALFCEKDRVC